MTQDVIRYPADTDVTALHALGANRVAEVYEDETVVGFDVSPAIDFALYEATRLQTLKEARIAMLRVTCATTIVSGFQSAALGEVHTYPSDATAQINLMGSVTDSLLPDLPPNWATPFWCADETGAWAYRAHTATQIRQVGRDGKAHVVFCQTTLATLNAQVAAAKTVAAVNAIDWPE